MPRSTWKATLLLLWGSAAARGARVNEEVDLAAEKQAIREIEAGLSAAAQARDVARLASFFAEDGMQLQPNMPPLMGPAAIEEANRPFFAQDIDLSFETAEVVVARSGDLAYARGTYRLRLPTPGGPVEDNGKYVVVYRKVNGEWKAAVDIFNSNVPAAAPQ